MKALDPIFNLHGLLFHFKPQGPQDPNINLKNSADIYRIRLSELEHDPKRALKYTGEISNVQPLLNFCL